MQRAHGALDGGEAVGARLDRAQPLVGAFDRANVRQIAVGEFAAIDNQVDTTTGTVKLRASFDNAADALFPSQFVNVVLMLDTLKDVITVPVAAVQHGAPGTYVYLVDRDNTVSVHPITVGTQDGDWYAALAGLSPGDRVVTDGVDRLRDGAHVNIPAPQSPAGKGGLPDTAAGVRRHGGGGGRPGAPTGDAPGGSGADADADARRERRRQHRQEQHFGEAERNELTRCEQLGMCRHAIDCRRHVPRIAYKFGLRRPVGNSLRGDCLMGD